MTRKQITLDDPQLAKLARIQAATGAAHSETIRRAVDAYPEPPQPKRDPVPNRRAL